RTARRRRHSICAQRQITFVASTFHNLRLEDPNYGKWTLQTLFSVARKLNVAVVVRFVDFPTFLTITEDMSENASDLKEFNQNDLDKMLAQRAIALPSQDDARPEGAR